MQSKENALQDYINMIVKSWTYGRMTAEEKAACLEVLNGERNNRALKGNYCHRWDILNSVYGSFLRGLGYTGPNWREPEQTAPQF